MDFKLVFKGGHPLTVHEIKLFVGVRIKNTLVIAGNDSDASKLTFFHAEIFIWTTDKHSIGRNFQRSTQPFYRGCIKAAVDNEQTDFHPRIE